MGLEYGTIIRSVSEDQNEILHNILKLYNNGNDFDCDPTYSKGGYYNKSKEWVVNSPKHKFDVFPEEGIEGVIKIEPFGKFPLETKSIWSINIDLPFVISVGPSIFKEPVKGEPTNCIIARRFSGYYPKDEMYKSYYHFLKESFRVLKPGGICVWKTQRTISGSRTLMSPEASWMFASDMGFYPLDRFTLIAKNRLWSGKVKEQQHSRSFDSQFYVFQKPDNTSKTKQIDYYYFQTEEYQRKYKNYLNK
jgi:hypothetical protein